MLTRRSIDLPSGPDPLITPATSIDGRFQQLEAALAHERQERRRILEALSAWAEWLNGDGALDISDAAIVATEGIKFPATENASTDANTLDDYEESSTTPAVTSGTGALTTASTALRDTKIGNRYLFNIAITITTNGTGATDLRVTLPYTAANTTGVCGTDNGGTFALLAYVTGSTLIVKKYDGTYPGADGVVLRVAGQFQV